MRLPSGENPVRIQQIRNSPLRDGSTLEIRVRRVAPRGIAAAAMVPHPNESALRLTRLGERRPQRQE